jgi:hypothetical protein
MGFRFRRSFKIAPGVPKASLARRLDLQLFRAIPSP